MDKNEIKKLIEQEKKTIVAFQKFAVRHQIPKEQVQDQIDHYLDTLNKLNEMLGKLNDSSSGGKSPY